MQKVIIFYNQTSNVDAEIDIASSGGDPISSSFTQETGVVEIVVNIDNEETFRNNFSLTLSYTNSNYS